MNRNAPAAASSAAGAALPVVSPAGTAPPVASPAGTAPAEPEAAHAAAAARVWQGLRTLVLDRHDRRREVCAALGMSFIRAKALRALVAGPLTMRQLAERLAIDPPYATHVVDDLQRRELVRRDRQPSDRRLRVVSLTPAGARAAAQAERILNRPPAAVADLDGADLATLDRIVTELLG